MAHDTINDMVLIAYSFPVEGEVMPIRPASSDRDWMTATSNQFAKRCLPLLIANQAGWMIHNVEPFEAIWDGGMDINAVTIRTKGSRPQLAAKSHFGHGIITWHIPYLFRTPASYNLLVRGPTNSPKDGATPLDGIVETDWAVATFTMNWKLTRPGLPVRFGYDEPICMISPMERELINNFHPSILDISGNPALQANFEAWTQSRTTFIDEIKGNTQLPSSKSWQKHYFNGITPTGGKAESHQTKLNVRPFENAHPDRSGSSQPERLEPVNATSTGVNTQHPPIIIGNFLANADELRAIFEKHFGSAATVSSHVLPSWTFQFDPPHAVYLSASVDHVFGRKQAQSAIDSISGWAMKTLGLRLRGEPSLNLYVHGCYKACRFDILGRMGYSFALTSNNSPCTAEPPSESNEEQTLRFNQLLVSDFNSTYQWTVKNGAISPFDGVLVIEGVLEEYFDVKGSISRQTVHSIMALALDEINHDLSNDFNVISGFATIALIISPSGQVENITLLMNRFVNDAGGIDTESLISSLKIILLALKFPSSGGATHVTLPLVMD
jgi:hypothetical protein